MLSHQFPPSSPLAAEINKSKPVQFKKDLQPKQLQFTNSNNPANYPSPLPSSSIGIISSSPVKNNGTSSSSSPSKETDNLDSSFILDTDKTITPEKSDNTKAAGNFRVKVTIPIELHPNKAASYNIGRQSTNCDIVLPRFKLISRKHAILSYTPNRNQLKLTCLGLNGLIVSLPHHMSSHLVKTNYNKFEFSSQESAEIVDKDKQLLKRKNLTSFVLCKDETVTLPFMNNTIIDFRNVELLLTMKQLSFHDHIRHEESIQKVKEEQQNQKHTTPLKPQTPIVNKQLPFTPISTNMTSDNFLKRPPSVVTEHTHHAKKFKHHIKKISRQVTPKKSTQEIIASLNERGINCQDLQHVLANYLAFANVQQTPLSLLMDANSKIRALEMDEVRALLTNEPCIGVIYRQGKDAAGKPLEEEYYYDLENDPNLERKMTVQSIKGGRTGLRACRKTHKQYFWKKPAK